MPDTKVIDFFAYKKSKENQIENYCKVEAENEEEKEEALKKIAITLDKVFN